MVYKILWPGFLVIKVLANLKVIILMALQTAIVKHEAQFYGNYGLITLLYNLTFPSLNYHHWNVFALLLSSQVSCTECRTRRKTLLAQTPRGGTFCFLTSHLGARQWTILCRNTVIEFCSIMHSGSTCLCLWVKLPTGCGWDWNCWIAWEKTWKTGIPKPISGICSNRECHSIYGEFLGLVFWTPVVSAGTVPHGLHTAFYRTQLPSSHRLSVQHGDPGMFIPIYGLWPHLLCCQRTHSDESTVQGRVPLLFRTGGFQRCIITELLSGLCSTSVWSERVKSWLVM